MQEAARLLGGRYRLGARLGGGGMADVYRGMDIRLQRVVAVKVFRSGTDETGRARFEEEARLLAGLNHPGLVSLYDASASDDEPYLVMQLVEGETLAQTLLQGPLPPQQVRELGRDLAEVLEYVHANGIVHRDVKPSNVLLSADGVFLADFGISRLVDAVGNLTGSEVVGTAAYMAPEQVRGRGIGYVVDVYSLGLVLLECVTGHVEYPGTSAESALARLARPPHFPDELPEPLASVLRAMTAEDPQYRPSAADCVAALRGERMPVPDPTRHMPQPMPEPDEKRRRWWPWVSALAGVLVVLAAVLVLRPGQASNAPHPKLPPAVGAPGVSRLPSDLANLERMVGG